MLAQMFENTSGELRCGITHDSKLVKSLVNDWHSVLRAPQGWRLAFLLSCGNRIVGVATLGRPVARHEDQDTTLELTRMALRDAPKNSATKFMRLMREYVKVNCPQFTRMISYQDIDAHRGTIYKADNWKLVYEKTETASWTNRPNRQGNERKHRAKWEHSIS